MPWTTTHCDSSITPGCRAAYSWVQKVDTGLYTQGQWNSLSTTGGMQVDAKRVEERGGESPVETESRREEDAKEKMKRTTDSEVAGGGMAHSNEGAHRKLSN